MMMMRMASCCIVNHAHTHSYSASVYRSYECVMQQALMHMREIRYRASVVVSREGLIQLNFVDCVCIYKIAHRLI